LVTARRLAEEGELRNFVATLGERKPPLQRVPGTAIYPHAGANTTPLAFRINVEHNHIRHEQVIIVYVKASRLPAVRQTDRISVDALGDPADGIVLVTARFGFREQPDIPAALRLAVDGSKDLQHLEDPTYFLSRIVIRPATHGGMALWRKKLFSALARNAASPAEYFQLPDDCVVSLGTNIVI
jgi:KUP system potassium uptake protein